MARPQRSDLDHARDDLISHIHRCGVLRSTPEQQTEWMNDTVEYMGECYPSLSEEQLAELKAIGLRFCQPVIAHGKGNTALSQQEDVESESGELAGV